MGREGGERGRQPFYTPPILGACDRSHGSRIIYTLLGKQHGWLAARGKVPLCEGAVTTSQMRSEVDLATRRGLSTISAGVFKSPPRRPVLVYSGLCFAGIGFLLLWPRILRPKVRLVAADKELFPVAPCPKQATATSPTQPDPTIRIRIKRRCHCNMRNLISNACFSQLTVQQSFQIHAHSHQRKVLPSHSP
jgi:hypothetical protein